ncbi:fluoride efflux transporter CrcB [Microbispora triticiradicis]|uniref:Fluoride-specific ion channel FluC n=1 Tax=Microbispora triticiradicis TaxID=2200763 RepID=A0ABX9LRR0_9ACTN|nr:fluoride efflux transporter CrcB [Microbispora triticiradicis]RGA06716.1 fluoride efflux transporter CrcB [Microbispora triticiradicis]GLW25482.1 putative fluoride ion transporter CrcB 2 [Microbispora amethystogenes]
MTLLLVFLGGIVGAPARYLADRLAQRLHDSVFPWGTLAVNVSGSLVLGLLLGARDDLGLPAAMVTLLGTGFCGAFTTFSTFGFETVRLLEEGAVLEAGLNALGSLVLGVLAAAAGIGLAHLLA